MVDESSLTTFSTSSKFVQQYALGNGLLEGQMPETDIIFTGPMIILIDALIRTNNSLPFDQLEAGTGLDKSTLRSAVDKCEESDIIVLEDGGISMNEDSDTVRILKEVHQHV